MTNNVTGAELNRRWRVNAEHALFHREGKWFHLLDRFPGALFDSNGYLLFETEEEYRSCNYINITKEIWVPNRGGISAIPGYVKMVGEE